MQQNAAFSNQLEERSPTWPSQRHETKQRMMDDGFTVSGLPDVTFTSNLRLLVAWPIRF